MKIDRSNYELWLIDWLDGNLNHAEAEQFQHFLGENTDLKEEFDELPVVRLNPSSKSFPDKDHLKKTTADLSTVQMEYLSVAYLENDLTSDQQNELKECIEHDQEKKKSFELIQKMRLSPVALYYENKNRLRRRTVFQNVVRVSVIGLSAAAIITLILINHISKPKSLPVKIENTAQTLITDSIPQKPAIKTVSDEIITERKIHHTENLTKKLSAVSKKIAVDNHGTYINSQTAGDSLARSADNPLTLVNKIPVSSEIGLNKESIPKNLIALNYTSHVPEVDDGRSRVRKFIAKTFREKILKENTTMDSPLKAYEIAEAGVSGLNKLLGWEMVLDEKKDINGEPESFYFSSKILKFKAPVKKSEPLP